VIVHPAAGHWGLQALF